MGSFEDRSKRAKRSDSEMSSEDEDDRFENEVTEEDDFDDSEDYSDEEGSDDDDDDDDDQSAGEDEEEAEDGGAQNDSRKDDEEMEELEKQRRELENMEQSLVHNLRKHKDEDLLKAQAIKSQKALWDKALEIRILLQKAFSNSNRLPQDRIRSLFCEADEGVSAAYSDLIVSSKKTIDSLVQLQEALLENNPSISEASEEGNSQSSVKSCGDSEKMDTEQEQEWLQISQIQSRVASFRNKSIDKWQRKADVQSGAAAKKAKLLAFNQNISDQVATYMRDPSQKIRDMQLHKGIVGVFGTVAQQVSNTDKEVDAEGDPETLDDRDFYEQLLKEFYETIGSSEEAFYVMKELQNRKKHKKRKVVDRRASKSRKIRYNVHEKIVNFMAPQPVDVPPMAPKLFQNLFGLKTQKLSSAA